MKIAHHRHLYVFLWLLCCAAPVRAQTPSLQPTPSDDMGVVRGIEIIGTKRVDAGGVRAKIYTQIGRVLDPERLSNDLKRIYRMGFFEDVQIAEKAHPDGGKVIVFRIVERPTIIAIEYDIDGDSVDLDEIKKVVNIRPFDIFDEPLIRFNLSKIEELYREENHYLVATSFSQTALEDNGVKLTLHVEEGQKVVVRNIHIVGNSKLKTDEIKGIMQTREGGLFSFLTKSGQFKKEHFDADIQRIQMFLLSKGFVEAKVEPPQISLSPDKRSMSITIRLHEGKQFRIGKIEVEMNDDEWLVPRESLESLISLEVGEIFDWMVVMQDAQRIGDIFRDLGYANATVSNGHKIHADKRAVDLLFTVQKGELVYIGRIEVRGNKNTRDKVVRRELKIIEGELYSASKLKYSKMRTTALGFFENVQVTPQPTSDPTRMDVFVDVKERQTGTFQVGAGFSSLESFILQANIQKDNFLGRGQTVAASAQLSGVRQNFDLRFHEPYFFDSRLTFAFRVFNSQFGYGSVMSRQTGGTLSWGYNLTDELWTGLTYSLTDEDLQLRATRLPIKVAPHNGVVSSLRASAAFDNRDNRLFPSKGNYTYLAMEYADQWLGSQYRFLNFQANTRFYFPLFWGVVFKTNAELGYVTSLGSSPIPLFERYRLGGIRDVRGFEPLSIGRSVLVTDYPDGSLIPTVIGGTKQLVLNAEFEIPIFLEVGIRGVLFFDAGNTWDNSEVFDPFDLRTSAGFGFRWQSPIGPLRFEWGFPLDPQPGEDPVVFEFTIGNSF